MKHVNEAQRPTRFAKTRVPLIVLYAVPHIQSIHIQQRKVTVLGANNFGRSVYGPRGINMRLQARTMMVAAAPISRIYVLICVGLAVDYAAHIAHMFKESPSLSPESPAAASA